MFKISGCHSNFSHLGNVKQQELIPVPETTIQLTQAWPALPTSQCVACFVSYFSKQLLFRELKTHLQTLNQTSNRGKSYESVY